MTKEQRDEIINRSLPDNEVAKRIEEINTPDNPIVKEDPFLLWLSIRIEGLKNGSKSLETGYSDIMNRGRLFELEIIREKYLSLKQQ
jgi:hypothetical protein